MKSKIGIFLSMLLVAGLLQGWAQDTVSFRIVRNVAILEGTINDTDALFIIDTGASITILNESLAARYKFRVIDNKFFSRRHIVGLGGQSAIKEVRSVRVKIGPHEIKFINKATNLDNLSAYFNDRNIRIAGIIGTDLLCLLGGNIDFRSSNIVLHCRKAK